MNNLLQKTSPTNLTDKPMGLVPKTFDELWRIAKILATSKMVPRDLSTPEDIFVAAQMGLELNLYPIQAIQNIAVINGRPALWGDAVIGLVLRSGLLDTFEERFEGTFPDDEFKATCTVKRKGLPNIFKKEFSIEDAKNARLWCLGGTDHRSQLSPWAKYPKRMLQMRARSWALRDSFADILKGFYPVEEAIDIPPVIESQRTDPSVITARFAEAPPESPLPIDDTLKEDLPIKNKKQRGRPPKTLNPPPSSEVPKEPPISKDPIVNKSKNAQTFANLLHEQYVIFDRSEEYFSTSEDLIKKQKAYFATLQETTHTKEEEILNAAVNNFGKFWEAFIAWLDNKKD